MFFLFKKPLLHIFQKSPFMQYIPNLIKLLHTLNLIFFKLLINFEKMTLVIYHLKMVHI